MGMGTTIMQSPASPHPEEQPQAELCPRGTHCSPLKPWATPSAGSLRALRSLLASPGVPTRTSFSHSPRHPTSVLAELWEAVFIDASCVQMDLAPVQQAAYLSCCFLGAPHTAVVDSLLPVSQRMPREGTLAPPRAVSLAPYFLPGTLPGLHVPRGGGRLSTLASSSSYVPLTALQWDTGSWELSSSILRRDCPALCRSSSTWAGHRRRFLAERIFVAISKDELPRDAHTDNHVCRVWSQD